MTREENRAPGILGDGTQNHLVKRGLVASNARLVGKANEPHAEKTSGRGVSSIIFNDRSQTPSKAAEPKMRSGGGRVLRKWL